VPRPIEILGQHHVPGLEPTNLAIGDLDLQGAAQVHVELAS
jgi:hypothetical protein